MTDEELKEKVIRYDYEFQALTGSLKDLSKEMKDYIANIIRISNEAELNGTQVEDTLIIWYLLMA